MENRLLYLVQIDLFYSMMDVLRLDTGHRWPMGRLHLRLRHSHLHLKDICHTSNCLLPNSCLRRFEGISLVGSISQLELRSRVAFEWNSCFLLRTYSFDLIAANQRHRKLGIRAKLVYRMQRALIFWSCQLQCSTRC